MDIGSLRHLATFENPSGPIPDGDGGYTRTYVPLSPSQLWVDIRQASVRDLERATAGTVMSSATHIIRGRFHPDVTTKTRITFRGRIFEVQGVNNVQERNTEMEIVAAEVVT